MQYFECSSNIKKPKKEREEKKQHGHEKRDALIHLIDEWWRWYDVKQETKNYHVSNHNWIELSISFQNKIQIL